MKRKTCRIISLGILFSLLIIPGWAVCSGNNLGTCSDLVPQNCVITRAAVGTNLDAGGSDNVVVGRTSFDRYPVEFTHDGATSSFTVSVETASPTDSGTSVTESSCEGKLTAFFSNGGQKLIKVRVAQINLGGRIAISRNALDVIYDNVPPVVTPLQVFIGAGITGEVLAYSAGTTYFTSTEITITARVTDPNPAAPLEELGLQVIDGLTQAGAIGSASQQNQGIFELPLGLGNEENDGTFLIKVVGLDSNSGFFPDGSPANRSEPVIYRAVLDRTGPILTKLEAILNAGSEQKKIVELPGVFIPSGTVRIRATFSEKLKTPPTLTVTQIGSGVGEPPQPYAVFFDPEIFRKTPSIVEYVLTPLAALSDIGPISLTFAPNGVDLAGNPLRLDSGVLGKGDTIERALILDTIPPDLNRTDPGNPGLIQSEPRNGQKIPRGAFPEQITIIVKDYDIPENIPDGVSVDLFARENSSGVDFTRIIDGNTTDAKGIKVELRGPNNELIPGTLATRPPNGLVYILQPESDLFEATGGRAPEGIYRINATIVDLVGNQTAESIIFEVDNTDITPDRVQVSLAPVPEAGANFQPDVSNPLLKNPIQGVVIPENPNLIDLSVLDSVRELQLAKICSSDPTFDLTGSVVSLKARLNGPDTIPRELIGEVTANQNDSDTSCDGPGSTVFQVNTNQRPVFPSFDFSFPNPSSVGQGVAPGERDPRFGLFDGPYLVEILARDLAGNISDPIQKEFLLDTTPPYTEETFPRNSSKINSPLRHVSAIVIDPHPPKLHVFDVDGKLNFGSGISEEFGGMTIVLQVPYRPSDLDSDVFNLQKGNEIIGRLSYTHRPNSIDPTLSTFNPKDDTYRVLLEFIDRDGSVVTLPTDGSADGIYRMDVTPVDNAGNSIDGARNGGGGYNPFTGPEIDTPKELKKSFFFLMDTIPPHLTVKSADGENNVGSVAVSGDRIQLTGEARDLSAQLKPENGGSGIQTVEFELVLMVDGVVVPGVPAEEGRSAKPNPILTGKALLEAISNISSDPHTSETRPLDPDTYPAIVLESRKFRIDFNLPERNRILKAEDLESGGNGVYFLRVKARDFAGNETIRSVEVQLNFSPLSPPELVEPPIRASQGSTAITFKWKNIPSAEDYLLAISLPSGEETTVAVKNTSTNEVSSLQILNQQGTYFWQVTPRDSVGNLGNASLKQEFRIDTRPPTVDLVNFSDLSPEATARITRGQFTVQILFNEDLSAGPTVHFQPFTSSIPKQVVTTTRLQGKVWEGLGQIPADATANWDGVAILWIEGARDLAGSKMLPDKSNFFEIETGPDYGLRFFQNPVMAEEIVLLIRSSEPLSGPPVIFSPIGVELLNEELLQIGDRSFSALFRLVSSLADVGSIELTGRDLSGNPSTRKLTFPLQLIRGNTGGSLSNSRLRLNFPPGAFEGDSSVALLPGSNALGMAEEAKYSVSKIGDLKMVSEVTLVVPENLPLIREAQLRIFNQSTLLPGQAYYLFSNGVWQFLGKTKPDSDLTDFSISNLGRVAIMEDLTAPVVTFNEEDLALKGDSFQFEIQDYGSGVDPLTVNVSREAESLDTIVSSDGKYSVRLPLSARKQDLNLRIEAKDRAGNGVVREAILKTPGPVKLEVSVFPNPARNYCNLRYKLSHQAEFIRLKILDSRGKTIFLNDSDQDVSFAKHAGSHDYQWQLEDQIGRNVANGIYFAEFFIRASDGSKDRVRIKMAVLR